ncbi:unnamed protein product [Symbiodinium sp. CCMP2592]|nr:unnamed protein product [Symbiodinium sp. CCMP2592]
MVKVLCVLYEDPAGGYPSTYSRDDIPVIKSYPGGQSTPTPSGVDFAPGQLLGSVSGALGLTPFLAAAGHEFVVTSSKDGPDSVFERELPDADVAGLSTPTSKRVSVDCASAIFRPCCSFAGHAAADGDGRNLERGKSSGLKQGPSQEVISQPFWPAYMSAERFEKAKNLKLCITAGIGSDHVDLQAACNHGVTVAEVTFCNSISVAEHVVMLILNLVRNFVPSHDIAEAGGWHIADCVAKAYDVEGMHVGTVAAGRIGLAVLRRLKAFETVLHYYDKHRLPESVEQELNLIYHDSVQSLVKACDVVTINCPLHPETENLFNEEMIYSMKRGAYLINTARGKICDAEAVKKACEEGHLAGYAGDVWFPQPAPADHPWRGMKANAMTPHVSGTTLSAQARYAAGVREILECFFDERPIRDEYLIVHKGQLAGTGKHSYTEGNTTKGSEDVAKFKGLEDVNTRPAKLQRVSTGGC